MKIWVPLVCALFLLTCTPGRHKKNGTDNNLKKYTISGTVLEQRQYCGGARPSEEILHPKPAPVGGLKLYIRKSSSNETGKPIIDSIVSAADGTFSIQLPQGHYCFIEAQKRSALVMPQNDQYNTYDTTCYRINYSTCDFSVEVKSDLSKVEIVLERRCPWNRPCVQFRGPLPPSAPPVNRGGNQPGHQE